LVVCGPEITMHMLMPYTSEFNKVYRFPNRVKEEILINVEPV
jgi:hypothetical protein